MNDDYNKNVFGNDDTHEVKNSSIFEGTGKSELNKVEYTWHKDDMENKTVSSSQQPYTTYNSSVNTSQSQNMYTNNANTQSSYSMDGTNPKKQKKSKKKAFMSYVAVGLAASLIGGAAGGFMVNSFYNNKQGVTDAGTTENAQNVNINLTNDMYYAAAVAEKSQKAVVGITTTVTQTYNSFFGPQTQQSTGMGSGFIVDSNGYIVTNAHVIGDGEGKNIQVSLIDGTTEKGEVLWYDTTLDLAIVKIEKTGLPTVDLGDSDELMVGEPVVAIGNPMTLELDRTVTTGIISGLNRTITVENGTIKGLIQTDASINSGNSGGPLFNAKGEVIGINTAKMSSAEGLGFSIPINTVTPILQQLMNEGSVSSLYIGITGTDVKTYEQALGVDLSAESGVVVIEIIKDAPAALSELKSGDVIVAVDDTKISDMSDLKKSLYNYKAGDQATIKYIRNGEEQTTKVTLQQKPASY